MPGNWMMKRKDKEKSQKSKRLVGVLISAQQQEDDIQADKKLEKSEMHEKGLICVLGL